MVKEYQINERQSHRLSITSTKELQPAALTIHLLLVFKTFKTWLAAYSSCKIGTIEILRMKSSQRQNKKDSHKLFSKI